MKFSIRLSFGLLLALMMVSPAEAQFKFLKKKKPAPVAAKPAPPAKKNANESLPSTRCSSRIGEILDKD